ncbi:hypothetical protein, partial [Mycobacterium talmoniae]|uniref:hypothetical protein n=1 Tax=Mycobacterium talmoniae TaxID=1858794 RepID=UPI0009F4AC71
MTTKREAPARRGGDRRRRPDGPTRRTTRRPAEATSSGRGRPRSARATAPARETRVPRPGPQTATRTRPAPAKSTKQAKARAKARKAKAPKVVRPPLRERLLTRLASVDLRPRTLLAKVPFVVLVIGSLGVGLGATLWLSTDSAERSYQLGSAREENRALVQQKESLERDVLEAEAAPALAEAARNLGMIPSRDTAHLVQDPAGNWVVVGTPKPAEGVPLPPLNTKLPDEQPAPPTGSAGNPVEVPVRVLPGLGEPTPGLPAPAPAVLLRAPDGGTTLGAEHLPGGGDPAPAGPPAPGVPDAPVAGPLPVPAPLPPAPVAAAPAPQAAAPAPQPAVPA